MNTPHTHVYCNFCKAIRPIDISDMHQEDVSGRYTEASDLLCGVCSNHIATLYVPKSKTASEEALQRGVG